MIYGGFFYRVLLVMTASLMIRHFKHVIFRTLFWTVILFLWGWFWAWHSGWLDIILNTTPRSTQ